MSSASPNIQDENLFKILVATDIHLGVHEKDPVRGNDSFIAFEEILQHAVHNDVDFILLAGDLFHVANPSTNTLQKCMQLLRTYTLGDKQIPFEIKSDQAVNFSSVNQSVNYEDPDMNIKYPVFSIHGNHDDPSGFGRLSSLDLLATSGLVNYFGKWTDLTQVQIDPILIKKGETQLALYGLSHIHDNRLVRLFLDNKVVLEAPDESSGAWFNLLVLHQNRADRGLKNFLPESVLPTSLHLVIWGHEHDCRIFPEGSDRGFYVSQPGSSVATSLSEGEAIDKHVGLLWIHGTEFRMEPIKLKSVRPFVFDSIHLAELEEELGFNEGNTVEKVQDCVAEKVKEMMAVAKTKESDHPNQPKEPLIRLRVFYSSEDQLFNAIRFGQQYNQKVIMENIFISCHPELFKWFDNTNRIRIYCSATGHETLPTVKRNIVAIQRRRIDCVFFVCLSLPFCLTFGNDYHLAPHIGHLYSSVIADAIFRFEKLLGNHTKYIFTTGTDEHGLKVQQAAQAKNASIQQYCDGIAKEYRTTFQNFNVEYTDLIRTTESRHRKAVEQFWTDILDGIVRPPDETFLTESQLKEENGTKFSIESGHPVEWLEEENYMFQLSKYHDEVIRWLEKEDRIKPNKFQKILLNALAEPLPDVSVSRPSSRVHWAIRVPNDESHSIYVWLDALVNYLTCSGYPEPEFKGNWPATLHVIGKDILKFHGIYWPAFLIAADIEPPKRLLVHSHWTVDDVKMSKSKMNVVDPNERSLRYTRDGLRYFLLREGVAHSDGNYSDIKVMRILNSELADTLGNLLSRACAKSVNKRQISPALDRDEFEKLLEMDVTKKLVNSVETLPEKCFNHYKSYNFYLVVDQVIEVLHSANKFFETTKPWELKQQNEIRQLEAIFAVTMETLRICGIILQPIIPSICKTLLDKLNVNENQRNWIDTSSVLWNQCENNIEIGLRDGEAVLFRRIQLDENEKANIKSREKRKDKTKKNEIIS